MNPTFRLFPRAASTLAPKVDAIFWVLFGVCGIITLGIAVIITFFVIKYYHAPIHERRVEKKTQNIMEYSWTGIPLLLFLVVFAWAAYVYYEMHVAPANSMEIYVLGKQWMWKFQHANGIREINTLHVPINTPVKLIMFSEDVIHSFFIPQFRVKQDIVPGRYDYVWFEATETGEYDIFCTQYCGTYHADMRGSVIVMSKEGFQTWQSTELGIQPKLSASSMVARGENLFHRLGCVLCHGSPYGVKAPDLRGIYMSEVMLSTGHTVLADDNYLRESILNPDAKIVKGYQAIMPSFQGQLDDQEVLELIDYIKVLQISGMQGIPGVPGNSGKSETPKIPERVQ